MSVTYNKVYQDSTTIPAIAGQQFNVSNPLPAGLIESVIIQWRGTMSAAATVGSFTQLLQNLRIVYNGDQWFNFNTAVNTANEAGNSRFGALMSDTGGNVSEALSDTAIDCVMEIPCGIKLSANSRFELDLTYFPMGGALTYTGNFEIWIKYGKSSSAMICGNATSFPVPSGTQTMMTVAIPSYKGAKVSGIALQLPVLGDELSECIVQPLGNFGMSKTYLRNASGAAQNGYMFKDLVTSATGMTTASLTSGYYFIPLYDLATSSGSVNLLITNTGAGAATRNFTATPILRLPTGGSGESLPQQTASIATGAAKAILRRAED